MSANDNYKPLPMTTGGKQAFIDELTEKYIPTNIEFFVETKLERMYVGRAPTMRQVRDIAGDAAINGWLVHQINYMFELTEVKLDPLKTNSLIRLIRAKYQWMKLTEFMHYVFLFRTGEFGKIYGKADGQTVMLTLKDYCKIREDIIANIRRESEQPTDESPRPAPTITEAQIINFIASIDNSWRNEPWAATLARWYNCTKLPQLRAQNIPHHLLIEQESLNFPGNWTFERRRDMALSLGYAENTV